MTLRPAFATTAVLAVACLGALTGCSGSVSVGDTTPSVSASDVEDQIMSQLKTAEGVGPDSASCPDDLEGEVDATLTCTITDADGEIDVLATVTAVDGTDVSFDLEPQG